ncbi:MAG: hypothetical protein NTZ05_05815 [Chloroflexi bacterium]|nr:hypothetical protein [Chloroflexota bacterium]
MTQPSDVPALRLRLVRMNDNEVVFFDHQRSESWLLYPPRSSYAFVTRPLPGILVIERKPWTNTLPSKQHLIRPVEGCVEHGIACAAQAALQAAVSAGWDPFS